MAQPSARHAASIRGGEGSRMNGMCPGLNARRGVSGEEELEVVGIEIGLVRCWVGFVSL